MHIIRYLLLSSFVTSYAMDSSQRAIEEYYKTLYSRYQQVYDCEQTLLNRGTEQDVMYTAIIKMAASHLVAFSKKLNSYGDSILHRIAYKRPDHFGTLAKMRGGRELNNKIINAVNCQGQTPLHWMIVASTRPNLFESEIVGDHFVQGVNAMLTLGADPHRKDNQCQSPADLVNDLLNLNYGISEEIGQQLQANLDLRTGYENDIKCLLYKCQNNMDASTYIELDNLQHNRTLAVNMFEEMAKEQQQRGSIISTLELIQQSLNKSIKGESKGPMLQKFRLKSN